MKKIKSFIESLSPVKKYINTLFDKGLTPEKIAEKVSKENEASIGNTKAWVTMVRKMRLISSLSPVKSEIARLLDKGLTREKVAEIVSKKNKASIGNTKAWITMVINLFEEKGIAFKKPKLKSIGLKTVKIVEVATPKIKQPVKVEIPVTVKPRKIFGGEGKKCMRREVFKKIKESAVKFSHNKGTILTLSAEGCEMEIYISGYFERFNFLSYEMFGNVFEDLKATIKNYKLGFMLNPVNAVIYEAIKTAKKDTYAHLLLDF